jgi:hypothetical protein
MNNKNNRTLKQFINFWGNVWIFGYHGFVFFFSTVLTAIYFIMVLLLDFTVSY